MLDFGIFNFLSAMKNRQQFVRPVESISPIVDIAMKVNKIQRDELQPLEALRTRIAYALRNIDKLEISRYRAAVAMRLEHLDSIEDRRLLMKLINKSPVSNGTQTIIKKKPCRVRFVIPPKIREEETVKEKWLQPKSITPYFTQIHDILKFILRHLLNPVILRFIAKKIYVGLRKLIQVTTTVDIPNNTTTIHFRGFPRH